MRLAIVPKSSNNAVWWYRVLPWTYLNRFGVQVDYVNPSDYTKFEREIPGYDVMFIHCPVTDLDLWAVETAKAYRVKVVVDFDDLIWKIPMINKASDAYSKPEVMQNSLAACNKADVVTVSTRAIGEFLEDRVPTPIKILPNCFNDFALELQPQVERKEGEPLRVLWRGSATHDGDLIQNQEHFFDSPNIEWMFMGYNPAFLSVEYGGPLTAYSYLQWDRSVPSYFHLLKQIKPHLIIVPLEDNEFNAAKSNIAWIEATYAGAVCVASQLPEFERVPTLKLETGWLERVNNGVDWTRATSKARLNENYLLSNMNHSRKSIIQDL